MVCNASPATWLMLKKLQKHKCYRQWNVVLPFEGFHWATYLVRHTFFWVKLFPSLQSLFKKVIWKFHNKKMFQLKETKYHWNNACNEIYQQPEGKGWYTTQPLRVWIMCLWFMRRIQSVFSYFVFQFGRFYYYRYFESIGLYFIT